MPAAASLVVVGAHRCGKTTALAHLCHLLDSFPAETHKECRDLAKELGRPACEHAWMLDKLTTEREQGCTIDSSIQCFSSGSCNYTAIDTPGQSRYSKNVVSTMSLADIAVLVISAAAGEYEAGLESGYMRELALSCFTMGIKNIMVLVTKMDHTSLSNPQARFDEIKKATEKTLKEIGYKQKEKEVPFIPVSGLLGDNLVSRSSSEGLGWYDKKPFVEVLDELGKTVNRPAEKPLRLPVLKVHDAPGVGTVCQGRVETGSLRVGVKVMFSPSGHVAEVQSIRTHDGEEVQEAKGGDIVAFNVGSDIRPLDIPRGSVAASSTNDPAAAAETLLAQVVVLEHPGAVRAGYCPVIAAHTAQVPCEFEELLSRFDRSTGKDAEPNPESIKAGEAVTARLRPRVPVCLETFSSYPSLGRFAVREGNRTVGVGVIKEVVKRPIPKPRTGGDNDDS